MLEIENLHARVGTSEILRGLSLTVRAGEVLRAIGISEHSPAIPEAVRALGAQTTEMA